MVSHTCFAHVAGENNTNVQLGVEGRLEDILLEARMVRQKEAKKEFVKHPAIINGAEDWRAEMRTGQSDMIKMLDDGKVRRRLSRWSLILIMKTGLPEF
jgi:hypothetical protein